MNLKLRRLVRTPSSEQYALFDLDRLNDDYDPMSIGKVDLHYGDEGIYGTFLFWQEAVATLPSTQICSLAEAILQEVCEPMGLPAFYAVELFAPGLESYALLSNAPEDREGTPDE
jgi:hypothetical protein